MADKKDASKKSSSTIKQVDKKIEKSTADSYNTVADQYAIIATGGKQYQAVVGKTLAVEKIDGEPGQAIEFKEVLLRKLGDGNFEIGKPYVEGAVVKASIVKQDKDKKVIVFKFQRRKKTRVKKGHRQPITVVRFETV
jgi:large subunit ribosomal protein L21